MTTPSIILLLLSAQVAGPSPPEALRNFARARAELRTGRISCVVTNGPRIIGMPVVQYSMHVARNGDIMYSYDGDSQGVFSRDAYGYPQQVGRSEVLIENKAAFMKNSFETRVSIAPQDAWRGGQPPLLLGGFVDLRMIGMAPTWQDLKGRDPASVLSSVSEECTGYSVEREGPLHRVTLHYPDARQTVYEIDEDKGWNATRISGITAEGRKWECTIALRQTSDTWFPESVTLFQDGEPRTEWWVTESSFNSPDDAEGWEPADVGFESGSKVVIFGKPPGGKGLRWDGEKPVPFEEYQRRFFAGELEAGPTLQQMTAHTWRQPGADLLQRLQTSPAVIESFLSAWEFYVNRFVGLHELTDAQAERAYACLRRAQQNGNQYLSRSRDKFEALQKRRDSGRLSAKEAEEKFAQLRKPVDDIFEKQLKPCLEKIPTRKQRDAAAERSKGRINLFAEPRRPVSNPPEPPGRRP